MTVTLSGVTLRGVECHDWTPKRLFALGEQGAWYDPSDFSSMWQDSAGTTAVTAVEQPVGLMLDKSGRGNHATQSTAANRPTLSARYNLLTKTEQFDDAVWYLYQATVSANSTTAPDGTSTADTLTASAGSGTHAALQIGGKTVPNLNYTVSFCVKAGTSDYVSVTLSTAAGTYVAATARLSTATITKTGTKNGTHVASSIVALGGGWYRVSVTGSTTTAATQDVYASVEIVSGGTPTYGDYGFETWSAAGTETLYVWGADLRVANESASLPAYQRVNTSTDYDTSGFPPYLAFNGTSSAMATASIDFSATDKMTVCAGVRKSASGLGVIAELSASAGANNGAFLIPVDYTSNDFTYYSRGTTSVAVWTTAAYAAPVTAVMAGVSNISGPYVEVRVNGSTKTSSTASQGTGNYGNYPLYLGARGGSSFWFNGRLYSLLVRGAATSAADIANTETWVNRKTGAY